MNTAQITIIGNTTADPEVRFVGESQKLSFTVAAERSWKDTKTDEWQKETSFVDVVAWREVAENTARALGPGRGKGVRVMVTGRLVQRSWEDKESGQKRYAWEVVADEIAVSTRNIGEDFTKFQREMVGAGAASNGGARRSNGAKPAPARQPIPEDEAW
jgi:single-strand DNA-binding protein